MQRRAQLLVDRRRLVIAQDCVDEVGVTEG